MLVNSNEAKREGDDSLEEMKKHAKEQGYFDFAYVVDENHVLADAFGATKTPDVFLFGADMKLVYKGAIDDNSKDKNAVEEPYLHSFLEQHLQPVIGRFNDSSQRLRQNASVGRGSSI